MKKRMRSLKPVIAAVLLALVMVFSLAGCSSTAEEETSAESADAESADAASGDASADAESADAQEIEEEITVDLLVGSDVTSMYFVNGTGSDITKVKVRETGAEVDEDDESEGFSKLDMHDVTWEDGLTAQLYVDVYEETDSADADESADADDVDLVFNISYDIRLTLDGEDSVILHGVVFTEESVVTILFDEESGLAYLSYTEEDGSQASTLEAEEAIQQEEEEAAAAAAEAEAAAQKAAEEAAAAEEESSSSSSSSSGSSGSSGSSSSSGSSGSSSSSGSSGSSSSSGSSGSSSSSGSSGSSSSSGSSGSSSGSQSEDNCIDEGDLIFR